MFKWIRGTAVVIGISIGAMSMLMLANAQEAKDCYTVQKLSIEATVNNASAPVELTSVEATVFEVAFLEEYGNPLPNYDAIYHTDIGLITYVFIFKDGCAVGMINLPKVVYDNIVGVI